MAGQESYEYDPIGRLVRFTDSSAEVTEYTYDPAGNILSVQRTGNAAGLIPVLTAVAPNVVRRGGSYAIVLTGQRLQVGSLQASDPAMNLSNVQLSANQVTATLVVGASTVLGSQTLTFSNAQGTAHIAIAVGPSLPTMTLEPNPLALPPDNVTRAITLRLSHPDAIAHTVNIASSDATRVTASPTSVVIPAGMTSAQINVQPKLAGFASLILSSPTLLSTSVPVFLTLDFSGVNTSYAAPVGLLVGEAAGPSAPPSVTATIGTKVGVAVGPVLTGLVPQAAMVGATHSLVITGSHLPGTIQVALQPSQGVSVGLVAAESNSSQIALALAVDAGAVPGARRVVVRDGAGVLIPFADPARAMFTLTTGQPAITSIEPLFATPNGTVQLRIRGRHLANGQVLVTPATDLRIDSQPVASADGTELVAGIQVHPFAATGPRLVQVATPSGQSSGEPSSANQFSIVQQIQNGVGPIFAPAVGVVVGSSSVAVTATLGPIQAPQVGLVVGAAAHSVAPSVGLLGTSINLVVTGVGLQQVTTTTVAPTSGLTFGAFSVNPEGTQLTIPVSIDAGASRTMRRVVLYTATGRMMFSAPGGDQFLVVAPPPQIVSVSPQVLLAGTTATMTVRGLNFSDVLGIQFDPPTGLVAAPPFIPTQGGTVLSFVVQASLGTPSSTRTVIVTTAGGSSSAVPGPENTLRVATQVGPTYDTIFALAVAVVVGSAAPEQATSTLASYAANVGVVVESAATQSTQSVATMASNVGVVVGAAITNITPRSPEGFLKDTAGVLLIQGHALDQVTSVALVGTSTGVVLGAAVADGTGTQLTVPVTVSATAVSGSLRVRLRSGAGTNTVQISAVDPAGTFFHIGALPTAMNSVSPLVLQQGQTYTFTVRGVGLRDVYKVVAVPETGLYVGPPQWSTDVVGELLSLTVMVNANAPVGSRVVRLQVPGGVTTPDPLPSNTITVVVPF